MPIIKRLFQLRKSHLLIVAVLWLILVTLACLVPVGVVKEVEPDFQISDKVGHGIFYFVNTILFFLYAYRGNLKIVLLKVSLFSFLYGIIIDVLQLNLPFGRSAELSDVLANGIGILLAVLLMRLAVVKTRINSGK